MYMCICIYVYTCIYIYIYTHISLSLYIYIYIYTHVKRLANPTAVAPRQSDAEPRSWDSRNSPHKRTWYDNCKAPTVTSGRFSKVWGFRFSSRPWGFESLQAYISWEDWWIYYGFTHSSSSMYSEFCDLNSSRDALPSRLLSGRGRELAKY